MKTMLKIIVLSTVCFLTNDFLAQIPKNTAIIKELKKRGQLILQELGLTEADVRNKIQDFKQKNPDKAVILEQIKKRIETLKAQLETMDPDVSLERLKAYLTPSRIEKAKEKLINIRKLLPALQEKSTQDLQAWSEAIVSDSELWM